MWSFVLTLPAQYLVLLSVQTLEWATRGVKARMNAGKFGCSNYFHGSGLYSCSLGEMLLNPLEGIFVINFFTLGGAFVVSVVILAAVLALFRASHRVRG